jgi:CelD/BcsL family acetyltransferase involved in cellulose biosynthesis
LVEEQTCTQTRELDRAPLQVEVISQPERFDSIALEWDDLVSRSAIDHPFLSHTWLSTWWECFGKGNELHLVTVRAGTQLVAAAPMMRTQLIFYGVKARALTSIYNPHTPRFDFIIAAEVPAEIIYRLIWRELSAVDCDVVVLQQVPQTSNTPAAIAQLAGNDEWLIGSWMARPSPYIPLQCSYPELLSRLRGGYRYNLRKRHERLGKSGSIDVEVITEKNAVGEAMQDGLRIEAAAWKGNEGTAILSDPDVTAFYTRLAERQADLGKLRLSFLRVGGKRISFSFILHEEKTLYGVKIGYDPEYHTYSPGNMLLNLILQDACAAGLEEYDFLGGNDEWKSDWTKVSRTHEWVFLFPNRLRSRLLYGLKFRLLPRVKPYIARFGRVSTQQ